MKLKKRKEECNSILGSFSWYVNLKSQYLQIIHLGKWWQIYMKVQIKLETILKGSLNSIQSHHLHLKAKHCWALSTNFWKQKFCLFCLNNSSALSSQYNNLNFYWRWWDPIQAIFLNLFYFNSSNALTISRNNPS